MRPATTLVRVTVLVGVVAALCSCTKASPTGTPSSAPASGLPSISSVSAGRFATTVDLDDGGLVVQPPGNMRARLSAAAADTIVRATDAVAGDYRFALIGLGVVTIADDLTGPASTTAPASPAPAGATSATATTVATSTTTTAAPPSSAPGSTSTSGPLSASLPRYDGRLAWVGIVWGPRCGASPSTTTTAAARHRTDAYVAVIVDADTGRDVVAYTSAGAAGCSGNDQGPRAIAPDELVSVPWSVVGPSSTAITVSVPPCGSYYGWTEAPAPATTTLQVIARRPYDGCPTTAGTTQTVDSVVPLGSAQSQVQHAALGPVAGLRTLSGG